jgi:hypothetical protein
MIEQNLRDSLRLQETLNLMKRSLHPTKRKRHIKKMGRSTDTEEVPLLFHPETA